NRTGVDFYYSTSTDACSSWSETRFTSQTSSNLTDGQEWGDYNGLSVVLDKIAMSWTDNRSGKATFVGIATVGDVTPPPPPPPGGILTNGVPVTGLSGAIGSQQNFTLDVPAGATNLTFNMSGGTGDADLYVKFGSPPTLSSYDCRPFIGGNTESCPITTAQVGTYHVMIVAFSAYSGVSLTGSFTAGGGGGSLFTNNTNVNIPDNNPTGATSFINVTRTGASGSIKVSYDIIHTYIGDLKVEIFTPTGETAVLRNNTGGSANDIHESKNLNAGTIEASGNWSLKVTDNAGLDTGFIDSWSIEFL
ncbi:MAG: proprotein convertase P-domain-containing protein, partial [Alcanivoracaceae bacterium]|nr:proprotein convertase P-domain-containing protein [Alcanivoracaceae bacterium]